MDDKEANPNSLWSLLFEKRESPPTGDGAVPDELAATKTKSMTFVVKENVDED